MLNSVTDLVLKMLRNKRVIYLAKGAKESFIYETTLSTGSLGIQESESILDKGEGASHVH